MSLGAERGRRCFGSRNEWELEVGDTSVGRERYVAVAVVCAVPAEMSHVQARIAPFLERAGTQDTRRDDREL